VLYLVVGALWWPGILVAASIVTAAYRRARAAADTYALILDAAAHLYSSDLARQVGIAHDGPLDHDTGWKLTCLLQGRSELIPLAAASRPTRGQDPAEKI